MTGRGPSCARTSLTGRQVPQHVTETMQHVEDVRQLLLHVGESRVEVSQVRKGMQEEAAERLDARQPLPYPDEPLTSQMGPIVGFPTIRRLSRNGISCYQSITI